MNELPYPRTRTVSAVENVAGLRLADPYRWLEEDTEEVRAWQEAQARIASSYVRDWPHFAALGALVRKYSADPPPMPPRFAGGRWFRIDTKTGPEPCVVVAAEPFGAGHRVTSGSELAGAARGGRPPFLSWLSPAPDGSVLAIGICTGGSERNSIRLVDVATGTVRADAPPHLLQDGWTGGVTWLADSSGFFYLALTGGAGEQRQAIFLHHLGSPPPTEPEPIPLPGNAAHGTLVQVSAEGTWAVAADGLLEPRPVAVRDLAGPDATWRPFVTDVDGTVAGHIVGDRYVAITNVGAPRGRVVAIALDGADPNDISAWTELVPESEAVLRTLTPVAGRLYLTELVDTYSRVRVIDHTGGSGDRLALPAAGTVGEPPFNWMSVPPRADAFVFPFCTLDTSWAVYRHRPGDPDVERLTEAATRIEDAIIEDRWALSADGTRIPYHTVRLAGTDPSRPTPTLIFAYGGFNHSFPPSFPGAMAAFVAAGGIFVHAHLRGGSEHGRTWREAGRHQHKQNTFDDLYAVAEDLIARGVTSNGMLAVTGRSNGGLTAAVAVTQRPDLWRAAVPLVPMLDLIGGLRDPFTAEATRIDRGDPANPEDVRRLAGYSPYERIRPGTAYPAIFISAGAADTRCPPWHARKWAARLQAAQAGDAPVLLHVWDGAGHGQGTPGDIATEENTEWLSFVMRRLGMTPP